MAAPGSSIGTVQALGMNCDLFQCKKQVGGYWRIMTILEYVTES